MPAPSKSLATLRPDLAGSLTKFDLAMDRLGFVGVRVLPVLEVARQTGKFGVIPVEQLLLQRTTERSPGSGYNRGQFTFTDDSYTCGEQGLEESVDDREAQMYADYFDAELVAAQRALDGVLRSQEKRVADLIFNTTTWTGAALTTALGNKWDLATKATNTPVDDVENAAQKVFDNSGMWPNALVVTRKAFRSLRHSAQIVDRLKYQGFQDVRPSSITERALAQVFDLDQVLVAGSSRNSANEGAAATFAHVWDKTMAMVCRIAVTNDIREPCLGRIFHWAEDGSSIGGTMETYRDENVRADIVRARHDVHEKVLYKECAHLLTGVL